MKNTLKSFLVGGAVRDKLLNRVSNDLDYVVVGATVADMLALGFKPVGRDFPVFLHPETGAEFALARTERKSGRGYQGFDVFASPDVTLEEDLARRDLTINAMAEAPDGTVIDPFGGQADLSSGVLRHVSSAFAEDPLRVLRVARFAARYQGFTVADETMALMRELVEAGEMEELSAERVWKELSRGLMEPQPSKMFRVLDDCSALARLIPELTALRGVPQPKEHHPEGDVWTHSLMVLDMAAARGMSLQVRFAALVHDFGKALTPVDQWPRHAGHAELGEPAVAAVCARFKVPSECADLARSATVLHPLIHAGGVLTASKVVAVLKMADALRRPQRFLDVLSVCECDARGRLGFETRDYPVKDQWARMLEAVRQLRNRDIIGQESRAQVIEQRIHSARVHAVKVVQSALRSA